MSARDDVPGSELDAAMAKVLAAERSAREAVDRYAREAEQRLAGGRALEKAIAERAAARGNAVRAAMAARLQRRLDEIAALERAVDPRADPSPAEHERLDAAVERLADELIGARP